MSLNYSHYKEEEKNVVYRNRMPLRIQKHINRNKRADLLIPLDLHPYDRLKTKMGEQLIYSKHVSIYGVYYICCIGEYKQIVKEQLACIYNSGLFSKTQMLYCFICRYNEGVKELLKPYASKIKVIFTEENLYEKFALENFRTYIPTGTYYYLYYFHSKGVSHDPKTGAIYHQRRKNLDFFILVQHEICIFWLDNNYDAVGTTLSLYPSLHFSGNFWWTTSRHLSRLPTTIRDTYYAPEMYICSIPEGKYISVCQTTNDKCVEDYKLMSRETILKQSTNAPIKNIGCKHMAF